LENRRLEQVLLRVRCMAVVVGGGSRERKDKYGAKNVFTCL
jgi:hypothetical protein